MTSPMDAMSSNQNFESSDMELSTEITDNDFKLLLEHFSTNTYGASGEDPLANSILKRCIKLMKLDYRVSTVDNENGDLCPQYPSQLPILDYEEDTTNQNVSIGGPLQSPPRTTNTIYESSHDVQKIREQINRAKFARCRARFPMPVILYKGKYICRSSTLSGGPEIYGRHGLDYLFYGTCDTSDTNDSSKQSDEAMDTNVETDCCSTQSDWQLFDKVRSQDIKLLKTLNIGTIVDLMVEKKKVKFGIYVTSSEKVDKENRYSDFNIICLPYPGCEFFKNFHERCFTAEGLVFDWNQGQCDSTVSVPDNPFLAHLQIEWDKYKEWDLVTMTQNYIKYLLKYIQDNTSGILIHCISGWDRTPLFITLLRLSLWADGLAHQNLSESQILYLTIAFDWMLFGHNLSNRLNKGEEIFFFCFYVLKYLMGDEFSLAPGRRKLKKGAEKTADGCDGECSTEMLLDQESRGSNMSLSSSSQDPPFWFHPDECNGNELRDSLLLGAMACRTSPETVPGRRKRTESSTTTSSVHSSSSTGSWQYVTGTGSVRSSDSTCSGDIPYLHASLSTVVDDNEDVEERASPVPRRKEKLKKVRELFYRVYYSSIGKNVKYGPDSSLGAIIGSIAEKVGLSQRT